MGYKDNLEAFSYHEGLISFLVSNSSKVVLWLKKAEVLTLFFFLNTFNLPKGYDIFLLTTVEDRNATNCKNAKYYAMI